MQLVVKKPHIRLEGEIGGSLVRFLRDQYGEIEVIEDEDDELVEVTKSEWYRSISRNMAKKLATLFDVSVEKFV